MKIAFIKRWRGKFLEYLIFTTQSIRGAPDSFLIFFIIFHRQKIDGNIIKAFVWEILKIRH
jgi:hypothetical protein